MPKYLKGTITGPQKTYGLKQPTDVNANKKIISHLVPDSLKPKSFLTSNVKINSSTNIAKGGITKFLQIDPLLKTKITKNFEKGGKFSSILSKPMAELPLKKPSS